MTPRRTPTQPSSRVDPGPPFVFHPWAMAHDVPAAAPAPYEPPTLVDLGTLLDLTAAGTNIDPT